jgi:hypothetical protein
MSNDPLAGKKELGTWPDFGIRVVRTGFAITLLYDSVYA